jgi:hypothetical protein
MEFVNRMGLVYSENGFCAFEPVPFSIPDFTGFIALKKKQVGFSVDEDQYRSGLVEAGQIQEVGILPEGEMGAVAPNDLFGTEKNETSVGS